MKRAFDILFSILLLPLVVILAALISLVIWCRLGSPVLFRQERTGKSGKTFELIKFRTMSNALGPDGLLLPDDQRTDRLGHLLRSTGLDELPEIAHVLVGDMSFVGPRPLLPEYMDEYTPQQARRHRVRPGITGLAQVSGRTELTWEETFELDNQYIDTWSIWLDLKILLRTILVVFNRNGPRYHTAVRGKFKQARRNLGSGSDDG